MTADEVREIDEQLNGFGWTYNAASERFESRDAQPLEWEDIIVAVPDLSLNDLMSYEELKQRESPRARRKAAAA